jgi:cell wall-associated NlpC family hydrolase
MLSVSRAEERNGNASVQLTSVNDHDGLAIIAAALDLRVNLKAKQDCSHLVHTIYERAGFPYPYAKSTDIYKGIDGFQRVSEPQPGDLIVWRGHVGIVVNPARHAFFSSLRSGLGVDDYEAQYWRKRGRPRFYRYTSDTLLQDVSARDRALRVGKER